MRERLLQALLGALPDMVTIKDGQGRWLEVNRSAAALLGVEGLEYRGLTDAELIALVPERRINIEMCAMLEERAWACGGPYRDELEVEDNGRTRVFDVVKMPLFDTAGERAALMTVSRDVTERTALERALRESEARYHEIFNANGVSIWEEDFSAVAADIKRLKAAGVSDIRAYLEAHPQFVAEAAAKVCVRDVNDITLEIFGARDKGELLGSLERVFTPQTLECFREELIALAEGQRHFECESTNQTLTGETLNVLTKVTFPPEGRCDRLYFSVINTTERHRAEEALRRSEALLSEAQQIARLGNWNWNVAAGTLYWSDEAFRIYGLQPGALRPTYEIFLSYVHPDDRDMVQRVVDDALRSKALYSVEHRVLRADGRLAVVRVQGKVFRDRRGRPERVAGTCQDITESRRSEETNQRLGRLLDASSNEIYVADARTLRFVQVNQGAQRNLGYSREELLRMRPADIVPGFDAEHAHRMVEQLRNGELDTAIYESEHRRRDGSTYPVEIRLTYSHEERPPVMVAIVQDITERREAERLKDEFVSTVSHELRTPLTALRGAVGLLAVGMEGPEGGPQQQLLDIALKNSERLMAIIDDLLDIQRLEAGQLEFHPKEVELMPLVTQAVEMNAPYASRFDVSYRLEGVVPGARVLVDPGRLQQVLTNLLANGAKFSPEGETVEVAVGRAGGRVRVSVTDHGQGVPEAFRHRLFQKFAQADGSATRRHSGTGLGLSISKAIIERMGGEIGFTSPEAGGACFFFELPLLAV